MSWSSTGSQIAKKPSSTKHLWVVRGNAVAHKSKRCGKPIDHGDFRDSMFRLVLQKVLACVEP
jgi:hypothetical protein